MPPAWRSLDQKGENMRKTIQVILGVAALAASGCSSSLAYKPMADVAPATTSKVALQVKDARPADKGGSEPGRVGTVRGSYGIPAAMTDADPNVVNRTITEATTDALRHSGVDVAAGSPHTLVASVKHYWMDGMVGYKGTIVVDYELQDSSGKTVWSAEVKGAGGGSEFMGMSNMANGIFEAALSELAHQAATQFRSPEFQRALQ